MATLERAIQIAQEAHAGQVDKGGADYIGHPLRVMEMCETEEQKIVGVLHDVVEDSAWTFKMLEDEGFSVGIVESLKCLTKQSKDENYDDFIRRVMKNELAMRVKVRDLEDNLDLSRLHDVTDIDIQRGAKYYAAHDKLTTIIEYLDLQK